MTRILSILSICIMIVLLAGCTASPAGNSTALGQVTGSVDGATQVEVGAPAPDLSFEMASGEKVSLSQFRGKVVLLNFWKTDCKECVTEMPFIQQAYDELSSQGLEVLAINLGENAGTVQSFVQEHGFSLPFLLDTDLVASKGFNARYLPTTFLIDTEGVTQSMKVGSFTGKEEITQKVSALLAISASPVQNPEPQPVASVSVEPSKTPELSVAAPAAPITPVEPVTTTSEASEPAPAPSEPTAAPAPTEPAPAPTTEPEPVSVAPPPEPAVSPAPPAAPVPNRPPELKLTGDLKADMDSLLEFQVVAIDPDGDTLTFKASNLPYGAKFDTATGTFSWTCFPSRTYSNICIEVSDGELTDSETISITVVPPAPSVVTGGDEDCNT